MQFPFSETKTLSIEDFRRLGVRPHECRSLVIRQAAARSSKSLAARQLRSPTPQIERQLSQVVTSTYRLLDPRKRDDFVQRILVGRVFPHSFAWASKNQFRVEQATAAEVVSFADASLEVINEDELSFEEFALPQSTEATKRAAVPLLIQSPPKMPRESRSSLLARWGRSLDSEDLIAAYSRRSRIAKIRRSIQHPWLIASLLALLLGTFYGVANLDLRPESISVRWIDSVADTQASVNDDRSLTSSLKTSSEPITDALVKTLDLTKPVDNSVPLEKIASLQPQPLANGSTTQVDSAMSLPDSILGENDLALIANADSFRLAGSLPMADADFELAELQFEFVPSTPMDFDALIGDTANQGNGAVDDRNQADVELVGGEFLPDPFAMAKRDSETESGSMFLPAPSEHPERSSLRSIPSPQRQAEIEANLRLTAPQIGARLLPGQIVDMISDLEAGLAIAKPASDQHYVLSMLIARYSWLLQDFEQATLRLQDLPNHFSVTMSQLTVGSYVGAERLASLDESRKHLIDNGLILADQLIVQGMIDGSNQVISIVAQLASAVADETRLADIKALQQAQQQASNMMPTVKRVATASADQASAADSSIAGRYYCLIARRWDDGLAGLALATDPRLATLAKRELQLIEQHAKGELSEPQALSQFSDLADRWLSAADRMEGRYADSVRLHAIDLKRQLLANMDSYERLESQRLIEQVEAKLPEYLRQQLLRDTLKRSATSEHATQGEPNDSVTPDAIAGPGADAASSADAASDARMAATSEQPGSQHPSGGHWEGGMIGVVSVGNKPTPIRVVYQPGALLSSSAVSQVFQLLNAGEDGISVDFVGKIHLALPAEVRLEASSELRTGKTELTVDGQLVAFDPAKLEATVSLSEGVHEVRWRIGIGQLSSEYLLIQDAATGTDLPITHQRQR